MKGKDTIYEYYAGKFLIKDLASLVRLISLVGRESKSLPPPIVVYKMENKGKFRYVTFFSANFGLRSDFIILTTQTTERPKHYIRYQPSPIEKLEITEDTGKPVGAYFPLFPLSSAPPALCRYLDPSASLRLKEKRVEEPGSRKSMMKLEVTSLQDLIRFSLEAAYPLIFHQKEENSHLYFLLDSPLKIGKSEFGRILYWRGEKKINKPFLNISKEGISTFGGEKSRGIAYARLIYLTRKPEDLHIGGI